MNIQTLPIEDLKPADYNPRIIDEAELKGLVESIKTFGQQENLIVNKDMTVVSGHQRLKAMQELGITEAVCNVVDLDKKQEKKLNVLMNSQAISGKYDDSQLALILKELKLDDDYKSLRLDQLEPLNLGTEEIEEDEPPEVSSEPPVSKLGEIYQLGRHRVMCGDSTDKASVELLMGGKKANLVFTDPPYGMFLDADYSGMEGISKGNKYDNVIGDHDDFKPELITSVFDNFGYCKDIFMWGADYYSELLPNRNAGSWVVWDKMQGGEGVNDNYDKMFGSNFELCWSKARHKRAIARVLWKGIFGLGAEDTDKRVHPTQKPVKLSDWFIQKFTKSGDIIADVYLGGGSTLMACEQTDRICYGMELDPKYVDVIRKRYAKFIGKEEEWQKVTPVVQP